jgi:hypothetical protein
VGPPSAGEGVETIIQVEETRLRAWNRTDHPQLFYFSMPADGAAAGLVLAPHSFLDEDFPRGALDGLRLEVVTLATPPVAGPGAYELTGDALLNGVLRIPPQPRDAWWDTSSGTHPAPTGASALPASLLAAMARTVEAARPQANQIEPMHVPVITPSDGSGDGPPIPEDSPLPPV